MATKLYVVIGSEGEYSDRTEWVAGVFNDRMVAIKHVERNSAAGRARAQERIAWKTKKYKLEAEARGRKVTPGMMDYLGRLYKPVTLSPEEIAVIEEEMGPIAPSIDYDDYHIVTVPANEWGRFEDFEVTDAEEVA